MTLDSRLMLLPSWGKFPWNVSIRQVDLPENAYLELDRNSILIPQEWILYIQPAPTEKGSVEPLVYGFIGNSSLNTIKHDRCVFFRSRVSKHSRLLNGLEIACISKFGRKLTFPNTMREANHARYTLCERIVWLFQEVLYVPTEWRVIWNLTLHMINLG